MPPKRRLPDITSQAHAEASTPAQGSSATVNTGRAAVLGAGPTSAQQPAGKKPRKRPGRNERDRLNLGVDWSAEVDQVEAGAPVAVRHYSRNYNPPVRGSNRVLARYRSNFFAHGIKSNCAHFYRVTSKRLHFHSF